jgi:hypothetical protein
MGQNDRAARLHGVLNSSGFAFQIGVRREIESTDATHGWQVIAEEHFWTHHEAQQSGFVDFIVQHKQYLFSILLECKRVKENGEWLFLTPRDSSGDKRRLSAFWTRTGAQKSDLFGWIDEDFEPISPEAAYCTQFGQDEKGLLLERLADSLLPAVEAVGQEEMRLNTRSLENHPAMRLILPVIVTNAALFTAIFDAKNVSMASGRISLDDCEFREVPFIRFRKGLQSHCVRRDAASIPRGTWEPLRWASQANERSLLVVNSCHLATTLASLNVPANGNHQFGVRLAGLESLAG